MVAGLLVVLAFLLGTVPGDADAAPTRWCDRPVVACRTIECAPLQGRERHRCLKACKARSHCAAPGAGLGTVGIITPRCRQDPDGTFWFGHTLQVRKGNRPPVTVLDIPLTPRGYDPIGPCRSRRSSLAEPYRDGAE